MATSWPYRVSIVIVNHNSGRFLDRCLPSIADQTLQDHEVIIVDNNSTDGTDVIVREHPVRLLHERDSQTPSAARNTGIRHATGGIIAFTDADCIADEDWLRQLVAPFVDPEVGRVGGQVLD